MAGMSAKGQQLLILLAAFHTEFKKFIHAENR
jgi:hypothetical protein